MMRRMSYMPDLGLRKNRQGPLTFNIMGIPNRKHGLGYIGSKGTSKKEKMLSDYFVKEAAKQVF